MTLQLPVAIAAKIAALPPQISIQKISEIWEQREATTRQQIRRKVFPVRVQQIEGGSLFVAAADLLKFWLDGKPQPQPDLVLRAARNPHGRKGDPAKAKRRGRPTKASITVARQAAELAAGDAK